MKLLLCLLSVLASLGAASAQTPITYKCWCTLRGGAEKEYTVPDNLAAEVTLPLEVPDYGRVVCWIRQEAGTDKNNLHSGLFVSLSSLQQLQPVQGGSYSPILILAAGFAPVYNKRITVLDTPAYSVAIELIKS